MSSTQPAEHGKHRRKSDFSGCPSFQLIDRQRDNRSHPSPARRHSTAFHHPPSSLSRKLSQKNHPFSLQALFNPSGLVAPKHPPTSAGQESHRSRRTSESRQQHRHNQQHRQQSTKLQDGGHKVSSPTSQKKNETGNCDSLLATVRRNMHESLWNDKKPDGGYEKLSGSRSSSRDGSQRKSGRSNAHVNSIFGDVDVDSPVGLTTETKL